MTMRDPKLSPEEAARLLDPHFNDLIPGGPDHDNDGTLLDPAVNEIIEGPDVEVENPPNDLCPDYVEPAKPTLVHTGDLMSVLNTIAEKAQGGGEGCGHGCERPTVEIAPGLTATECKSGGLVAIYKDGRQIYDRTLLSEGDRLAMTDYLARLNE